MNNEITFESILQNNGLPQESEVAVGSVGGEIPSGTFDSSQYALKNHTHPFRMPDNQTIRNAEILGGFIRNTEIDIKNTTGQNIFNIKRTGANVGDVTIGDYSGGSGALWDYSAGVFTIEGVINASSGTIGGFTIGATEMYGGIIKTAATVGAGSTGVIMDTDGLRGYDSVLGLTFELPTDGGAPTFSSGIINETIYEISTNAVLRTSSTVGDGSASSAGILINNAGIYACEANQALAAANIRLLIDGSGYFSGSVISSTVTGTTITGGTIRTASSGARIEIDGTGANNTLNAYDGSGNSIFTVTGGGDGTTVLVSRTQTYNIVAGHFISDLATATAETIRVVNAGLSECLTLTNSNGSNTDPLLQCANVGSGADIRGTGGTWNITKVGKVTCEGLDVGTQKIENVVDPTSNQEAATKKYVDDNVSSTFSITAGEALVANEAVCVADGTETYTVSYVSDFGRSRLINNSAVWFGQTFPTHACAGKISKVTVKFASKVGTPTGTLTCSIRATSGGVPTGSDLVIKTMNEADVVAGDYDFVFASPLDIVPEDTYAILLQGSGVDGENYIIIKESNASNPYADGIDVYGSGESWSQLDYDWYFIVTQVFTAGSAYKTDQNKTDNRRYGLIGFSDGTTAKGASAEIRYVGKMSGFSGLTPGQYCYLSGTRGAIITATYDPSSYKVTAGIVLSATEISIFNEREL